MNLAQQTTMNPYEQGYMAFGFIEESEVKHESIEFKLGFNRAKRDEEEE